MFEGDSADTCAGKFPLVLMGGRAKGQACADPVARTPIGASGIKYLFTGVNKKLNIAGYCCHSPLYRPVDPLPEPLQDREEG